MPMFAHALCCYQHIRTMVVKRVWSRDRCGGGRLWWTDCRYVRNDILSQICVSPSLVGSGNGVREITIHVIDPWGSS